MQAGTVLGGRYQLIELIGAGGFGQVWKALDPRIDRLVAVKVLTVNNGMDVDQQLARFTREATLAGSLTHPSIVTVHDFGTVRHAHGAYGYIVMELLSGSSLAELLRRGGPLFDKALHIARDVASALRAAHRRKLVHRDIKPSNIITASGAVAAKVVDFGITKTTDHRHDLTASGVVMGSPLYMAPECFHGAFEPRSDMYSFGCVLMEIFTGKPPFEGTAWQLAHRHQYEQPPLLRDRRPHGRRALQDLIAVLLAKNPAGRPSAVETEAALREIGEGRITAPPGSQEARDEKHDRLMDLTWEFAAWSKNVSGPSALLSEAGRRLPSEISPLEDAVTDLEKLTQQLSSWRRDAPGDPQHLAPTKVLPDDEAPDATAKIPPYHGQDMASELQITAYDAVAGAVIPVQVTASELCRACTVQTRRVSSQACSACEGSGRVRTQYVKRVRIPAGMREGQQLRLRGLGEPGRNGGRSGDLRVTIRIVPE